MTFLIVLAWIVIGYFVTGIAATELAPLFGIHSREGYAAMVGMFYVAPFGAIAGGIFGYRLSKSFGDNTKARGRFLLATLAVIVAVPIAGTIYEQIRTRDHFDNMQWLTCYIRLPQGVAAPDQSQKITLELRSDKETRKSSPYNMPEWEMKDGRATAQSSVEVYRATTDRKAAITIGDAPTYVFKIDAPARPKTYSYESAWLTPENVEGSENKVALEAKCGM
jgi:hypothetical protein